MGCGMYVCTGGGMRVVLFLLSNLDKVLLY